MMMDMEFGSIGVSDSDECISSSLSPSVSNVQLLSLTVNQGANKLKRSSSAPMINQLVTSSSGTATTSSSSQLSHDPLLPDTGNQPRVRRFSASFGHMSPLSPGGSGRSTSRMRVCQLREEEGMDVVNREAALERNVQSSLQMALSLSQSCEELRLDSEVNPQKNHSHYSMHISDPLQLSIGSPGLPLTGCAASPTRIVGKQCYSPSLQQQVKRPYFCSSPSPSKKFTTRRSLSPIALRPSPLGVKRKWEPDETFLTPCKKAVLSDKCSGGLLIVHPSNFDAGSPVLTGSGSVGSIGTPESLCSSGSPGPIGALPYSPASLVSDTPVSPVPSTREPMAHFGSADSSSSVKALSLEGSDSSCDAMMTEELPMTSVASIGGIGTTSLGSVQDIRKGATYQSMDLSESLPQETLNI